MGRIVVTEFVSLDGVMEDPGGAESFKYGGWSFEFDRGADGDKFKLDETLAAEALLLGRKTYEVFADAWPSLDGDIVVHGSGQLAQTLLEADLVDELRLMVFPVVLGAGKRFFGETGDKKPLRLSDHKIVGDGVAIMVYEPVR